ncbi:hypothetical protein TB2_021921 [Malus domestica]
MACAITRPTFSFHLSTTFPSKPHKLSANSIDVSKEDKNSIDVSKEDKPTQMNPHRPLLPPPSVASICKLVGITCCNEKENHLISLQLPSMELVGKLPESLKFYHSLQSLDLPNLSSNSLSARPRNHAIFRSFQEVEAFEAVGAIPSLTSSTASCKVEAFKVVNAGYSKLILYSYWQSSCSWNVRFVLNLKGLPYEYKPVNLPAGEQFSLARQCHMPEITYLINDAYVLNPLHFVLLLVNGDTVVSDSFAILLYLEDKYPQRPLLPADPRLRALNLQ